MSFLKSILSSEDTTDIHEELEAARTQITALEKELQDANEAIAALSACVVSVASAIRELASEMDVIARIVDSPTKKSVHRSSKWNIKKDDDGYLN